MILKHIGFMFLIWLCTKNNVLMMSLSIWFL